MWKAGKIKGNLLTWKISELHELRTTVRLAHHQVVGRCNSPGACEFKNTFRRETLCFFGHVAPGVAEVGSVFRQRWSIWCDAPAMRVCNRLLQNALAQRWFIGSVVHWIIDEPLVHWFIDSLLQWFIDSLLRCFIESLIPWFTGSVIHCLIGSLNSLIPWIIGSLNHQWFVDSLIHWVIGSLIHRFIHSLIHWINGWQIHWFIVSPNHSFMDSLIAHSSIHWFDGSLIHWFILIHWPIGSLIHWFSVHAYTDSLIYRFIGPLVYSVTSSCHFTGISTAICSFVDAHCNFNTSSLLILKTSYRPWFNIISWF